MMDGVGRHAGGGGVDQCRTCQPGVHRMLRFIAVLRFIVTCEIRDLVQSCVYVRNDTIDKGSVP